MKRMSFALLMGFVIALAATRADAGPPTTGGSSWYNPTQWRMPTMPWSEPPRIRKKSSNVFTDINQSARRGWSKTRSALDPSRLFDAGTAPAQSKSNSTGFWGNLFSPSEQPKDVRTVNDFLSQPHPRQ